MTGEVVIGDTDVASHLMRGTLPETLAERLAGRGLGLTFVTIGELHRGAARAGWGDRRRAALAGWLERLPVVEGSERASCAAAACRPSRA